MQEFRSHRQIGVLASVEPLMNRLLRQKGKNPERLGNRDPQILQLLNSEFCFSQWPNADRSEFGLNRLFFLWIGGHTKRLL